MSDFRRRQLKYCAGFAATVLAAVALRILSVRLPGSGEYLIASASLRQALGFARTLLYVALFSVWGASFQRRTAQPRVRHLFLGVTAVTLFWMAVRTIKYYFDHDPWRLRMLWYSYYIPILFFPSLCLMIALYTGKPESYRLPRRFGALLAIPGLLTAAVLTNDLHQLVFRFPYPKPWLDDGHTYGPLYWVCIGWSVGCAMAMFLLLIRRCRLPGRKGVLFLPFLPLMVMLVWGLWCMPRVAWARFLSGDMPVTFCLFFSVTLESCMQCGLLPVNTHYQELFELSNLAALITDEAYRPLLMARQSPQLSTETMQRTGRAPVMLPGHLRLSGASVRGGHVLWTEDVSELAEDVSELEELETELADRHTVLQQEYETRRRRQSRAEKNRLYNAMQNQTRQRMIRLEALAAQLAVEEQPDRVRRLTASIAVMVAYLKRRNNLIFIAEESGMVPAAELSYCLKESLNNLRLTGADCEMHFDLRQPLPFRQVTALYDAFEEAAEAAMDGLRELYAAVFAEKDAHRLCLDVVCEADLSGLTAAGFDVVQEDAREWTLEYHLEMGGERV